MLQKNNEYAKRLKVYKGGKISIPKVLFPELGITEDQCYVMIKRTNLGLELTTYESILKKAQAYFKVNNKGISGSEDFLDYKKHEGKNEPEYKKK